MTFRIEEGAPDPAEARALLDGIAAADGVEPFGEAFVRGLSDASAGHGHVRLLDDATLVGVAAFAPDAAELAVAPGSRRRGGGGLLLRAVDERTPEPVPVWAHGDVPGAAALAAESGRRVVRELLQMTAGEDVVAGLAEEDAPEGVRLEDLTAARARMGDAAIDAEWLRVNNDAFDWHPEQGGWDSSQLSRARDVGWFDPAGVLFAVDDDTGEVLGFHWTKRHGDDVGEVYVIGLASAARGRGLGGWLTRAGMRHLRDGGARRVILYVEGDNEPAVRTYEKIGFGVSRRDVMYGL